MTEFTRDIKPIDVNTTPPVPEPTGSLVADVANLASTGLQFFAAGENKKRQARTSQMTQRLGDLEVELTKNPDLTRTQVLERLDSEIKRMAPDPSTQGYLRQQFASQRGASVRNQLVQQINTEEQQRQFQIQAEFKEGMKRYPNIDIAVLRGMDGTASEEEMLKAIQEVRAEDAKAYQSALLQQKSNANAEGSLDQQMSAVSDLTASVVLDINRPLVGIGNSFISIISSDITDPENLARVRETRNNLEGLLSIYEQDITNRFSLLANAENEGVRKFAESNMENLLGTIGTIRENVVRADEAKLGQMGVMAQILKDQYELDGLEMLEVLARFKAFPNLGPVALQALINRPNGIFNEILTNIEGSFQNMSSKRAKLEAGIRTKEFFETGSTEGFTEDFLQSMYTTTKDVINGPAITFDLTPQELDMTSGGLVSLLQDAADTDDPDQIREATKLLNSDNFDIFMKQVSPERQAQLGRSILRFNQDLLADRSDGSLKKIADLDKDKDTDIKYNADTGKFTYTVNTRETPQITRSAFVSSQRSVQASAVKIAVDEANKALEMIRSNAQYDEQGFTEEQLVDTMLSRYLPEQLVQGTLKPFVPEEGSEGVSDTQEVLDSEGNPIPLTAESLLRLNQEIIKLKAQVMNQGRDTDNQED